MSHRTIARIRRNRARIFALLSGGLILGVGATTTLATWNDSEWVFGGVDAVTPGFATSSFEIEQNRGSGWDQHEVSNGGSMQFTAPALALTPGDASYAAVSLRTTQTAPVSVAGTVELQAAVAAASPMTTDTALWNVLELRAVVTQGTGSTCSAASFTNVATYVIGSFGSSASMDAGAATSQSLSAAGGNQQNFCFEVSLPASAGDSMQGLTASPMWEFVSTSS
jgi:predicted ribosomally synthesized peptide with SipW-like signal peptide